MPDASAERLSAVSSPYMVNGPNLPVLTGIGLNYLAKTGGEWWRPVPTCFVGLVKSALIELKEGIPIVQKLNIIKPMGFFPYWFQLITGFGKVFNT